jgi:hypothetical protein
MTESRDKPFSPWTVADRESGAGAAVRGPGPLPRGG